MPECARCAILAQPRARKNVPITVRISALTIAEIEEAARSAGIPRHRLLQAIFQHGTRVAIAELAAQAAAEGVQP